MCEYTAAILPLIEYASLATDVGGNDETYAPEECLGRLFGGVKL